MLMTPGPLLSCFNCSSSSPVPEGLYKPKLSGGKAPWTAVHMPHGLVAVCELTNYMDLR